MLFQLQENTESMAAKFLTNTSRRYPPYSWIAPSSFVSSFSGPRGRPDEDSIEREGANEDYSVIRRSSRKIASVAENPNEISERYCNQKRRFKFLESGFLGPAILGQGC